MAIDAGAVQAELTLKADQYFSNLQKANRSAEQFVGKFDRYGKNITKVGDNLTKKVSLPLAGAGALAVKLGMDFGASMSEVQAISGATGNDLSRLEEKARQMGATTKFSATDSAEAMKYMAMAGWETHQMLDGVDGVMNLAAASGEDLATVSDIVTDALTAFGMEAARSGEFADLLASASSNANTNVGMLGESFKYVAPLFGSLGYSAEDSALALGLMANAGIKGSQAGTSLRSAISRLVKPTGESAALIKELDINMTDAEGNMLPFKDVMDQLRGTFGNLTEEQQSQYAATIFGQEAMSGMLAIINASEADYAKLTKATRDYNGAAKEMSDIMQDNLKGDLDQIKSKLQEAGLQIAEVLIPIIRDFLERVGEWIDKFSSLDKSTQETIVKLGMFAIAVGPVLSGVGRMATGTSALIGLLGKFGSGAGLATKAAGLLGGKAGLGAVVATGGKATGVLASLGGAAGGGGLLAGLAGSLGLASIPIAPLVAGVAALTGGSILLKNALEKEVIPEVDLFANHVESTGMTMEDSWRRSADSVETNVTRISDATQEAVGAYLEMDEEVQYRIGEMYYTQTELTQDMVDEVSGMYQNMSSKVIAETESRKEEELSTLGALFENTITITEEEQGKILRNVETHWDGKRIVARNYQEMIDKIISDAYENEGKLTEDHMTRINELQEKMRTQAIETLSEQEVEAQVILSRMKEYSGRVTAEQASEMIENLNKGRDDAIAAAEQQYDESVAVALRAKNDIPGITQEQVDKMIAEAERQRKGTVSEAERTRDLAVDEIFKMNEELINSVDASTGEIISFWQKMFGNWDKWNPANKTATFTTIYKTRGDVVAAGGQQIYQAFAKGTDFAPGGMALVGEEGPELVELPRGAKVYTANETKDIARSLQSNAGADISTAFNSMTMNAAEWGKNVIEGFNRGIQSNGNTAVAGIQRLANNISGGFRRELDINSPSGLFEDDGGSIIEGLIKGLTANEYKAIKTVEDLGKALTTQYDKLGDAVMTALRNRYQAEERAQTSSIQRQIDQLRDASNQRIQVYNNELQQRLKILDDEMAAINNATRQEDRELQDQQFQEEKSAVEKRLSQARYASERESIQKELNDLIARRERELQQQERQDRIAAINEEKADLQEEYNNKVKHEEEVLRNKEKSLQQQIESVQEHYAELLKEENIQAEARRLILDKNNQELIELLESYNPYWQDAGQSFGESLLYGLNSMKQSIGDAINEMMSAVGYQNTVIADAQRDWQRAYAEGDQAGMDEAHRRAEEARNQGGSISADVAYDEYAQNMRIIEAQLAWQKAHKDGDRRGMDEAAKIAQEARRMGGTIGNVSLEESLNQMVVDAKLMWERGNEIGNTALKNQAAKWAEELRRLGATLGNIPLADALKKVGRNARGTNFWKGGLTWVGEEGPELIDLPRASKVYSNQKSMEMIDSDLEVLPLNLEIPVTLDGREIARATVSFTSEELMRLQDRQRRGRG